MKIIIHKIYLAGLILVAGCASGHSEPLPKPAKPVLQWNAAANATKYQAFYLTNTAPDFAVTTNSQNWTPLPVTTATVCSRASVPAGSLMTVVGMDDDGNVSDFATPITNPPTKTIQSVTTMTTK